MYVQTNEDLVHNWCTMPLCLYNLSYMRYVCNMHACYAMAATSSVQPIRDINSARPRSWQGCLPLISSLHTKVIVGNSFTMLCMLYMYAVYFDKINMHNFVSLSRIVHEAWKCQWGLAASRTVAFFFWRI